jgi:hypothetical protein
MCSCGSHAQTQTFFMFSGDDYLIDGLRAVLSVLLTDRHKIRFESLGNVAHTHACGHSEMIVLSH